jgi:triphosphatase
MELEIKLRLRRSIGPEAIEALELASYRLVARGFHDLHDLLLDTPEGTLAAAQQALRIRRDGERLLATFKGPPQGSGHFHQREEVEVPLVADPLHGGEWPAPIRAALGTIALSCLQPIVAVFNHRWSWQVRRDGSAVAELALDHGFVSVGGVRERFHEIEVELLPTGQPDDLATLDALLRRQLPVEPEERSKLERGLLLRRRLAQPGGKALATLGAEVLARNLDRLRKAAAVAREGSDPEGVHDFRVATRRLRTALQVLAEAEIRPKQLRRLRRRLRTLARAAALVRDAEVQLERLAEVPEAPPALRELLNQQRAAGREALLAALSTASPVVAALEEEITHLREQGEAPAPRDGSPWLVRHFAGEHLWKHYQAVLAYETAFPAPSAATLHQLRIAIKRLRYALEFYAPALADEGHSLRALLADFQELLGRHQDASVALELTETLIEQGVPADELAEFRTHQQALLADLAQTVQSRWHELGGVAFREALGQALAARAGEPTS